MRVCLKARGWCTSMLVLALIGSPASAAVRAYLSAGDIAPDDTVQLTLQHDGPGGGQPDLSPLRQDFDVLGTSTSTQLQIINGNTSASTDVEVTLSPKHSGQLTVPSITWDKERSPALMLNVSAAAGSGNSAGAGAAGSGTAGGRTAGTGAARTFIQTQIEPSHPYVQAAVQLTVQLYASQTLYRPDLQLSASADALVEQVGPDEQSTAERDGRTYRVVTRHYLLFPQRSGTLKLAGPVLDAQVADAGQNGSSAFSGDPFAQLFGSNPFGAVMTRPIRLHGDPIVLNVRARPAAANASYWLPATGMTLTSQWSPVPLRAHAGDPVTVKLHLQATGLTAAQLPDLSALWQLPPGLKDYPDQAQLHDAAQGDSVAGSRDQTIALIADQPGHFTIPALAVQWWDTATDTPQRAIVPARTLVILPAVNAASITSSSAPSTQPSSASSSAPSIAAAPAAAGATPATARASRMFAAAADQHRTDSIWRWIAATLAVLWLTTLGAWLWSSMRAGAADTADAAGRRRARRGASNAAHADARAATRPDPSQARAACVQACRRGDAAAARRHLLAWAAGQWPSAPPAGLNAVSRLMADAEAAALLRELDRACYLGGPWRGVELAERLAALRVTGHSNARAHRAALAPLYP